MARALRNTYTDDELLAKATVNGITNWNRLDQLKQANLNRGSANRQLQYDLLKNETSGYREFKANRANRTQREISQETNQILNNLVNNKTSIDVMNRINIKTNPLSSLSKLERDALQVRREQANRSPDPDRFMSKADRDEFDKNFKSFNAANSYAEQPTAMKSFLNDLKEDFHTIKRNIFGGSGSNRAEEMSFKRMDEVVSAMYGLNTPSNMSSLPAELQQAAKRAGIDVNDKAVDGIHKLSSTKGLFGRMSEIERYQQYVTNENEKRVRQYGDRVLGPRDKTYINSEGHILPQKDFKFGESVNGIHSGIDVQSLEAESKLQASRVAKNRRLADLNAGYYEPKDPTFTGPIKPGDTKNGKFVATPEQSEQYIINEREALKKQRAADKILAEERSYFNKNVKGRGGASSTEGMTTRTFGVKMATGGFGLGFNDALHASRMEGLTRAASFANPLGASSREIMMNAFGIQNDVQRMQSKMATGFFKKLGARASIGMPVGVMLYGMSQYEDVSSIATDQLVFGAAQAGWRVGTSLGIAATRAGGVGRVIGMGVGGVAMGALGGIGATLAIDAITDMTSNTSGIRAFAKKISGKEVYARGMDTRQSLTARQAALQKLSRSGLNDRAQLLGNEAQALRGIL